MPIEDKDRIKDESSVSRYMQFNVPGKEPGDDFDKHLFISKFDTSDKTILEEIRKNPPEQIVVSNIIMEEDSTQDLRSDVFSILIEGEMVEIPEPGPQSDAGEYNKMYVPFNRDGHTFLFDYTEDFPRTHLHHPIGSYFSIEPDGSWIFKSKNKIGEFTDDDGITSEVITGGHWRRFVDGDDESVIKGNENKLVKLDKRLQVNQNYRITVLGSHDLNVAGGRGTNIEGDDHIQIGKDKITLIGDNEIRNIGGFKEQNIQGIYTVKSNDTILFDSPTIELRTGNLVITTRSSLIDDVGGERRISANTLSLASLNDTNMTAGANLNMTAFFDASIKTVLTELILGTLGDVTLKGLLGSLNINIAGIATLEGTLVHLGGTFPTEPAMLGLKHVIWEQSHTHPTGVGPSGIPLNAGDLQQSLSKKVFLK